MKGFIEVHDARGQNLLINANAIEYIAQEGGMTIIISRQGEKYRVGEDYETVKRLILSALLPSFTTFKEQDDDRS